jgi:four helix bundle protein
MEAATERHYDKRENPIVELTFKFSLSMITFCEGLDTKRQYNLSRQLFRSATSIGANVKEAQNAESRLDFIHKMKISMKEVEETEYWLELCLNSDNYPDSKEELAQLSSIRKVLSKIIATSKLNLKNK